MREAAAEGVAGDHVGRVGLVGIEQEIDARKQSGLGAVGGAPVQEEGALVLERRPLRVVAESEVRNKIFALSTLQLPACHVGVDQAWTDRAAPALPRCRARQFYAAHRPCCAKRSRASSIEEVSQRSLTHPPKDGILREEFGEACLQRGFRQQGVAGEDDLPVRHRLSERVLHLVEQDTRIALDADGAGRFPKNGGDRGPAGETFFSLAGGDEWGPVVHG